MSGGIDITNDSKYNTLHAERINVNSTRLNTQVDID